MKFDFKREAIENDIMDALKTPDWMKNKKSYRKVYIESGAANDEIIDFEMVLTESVGKKDRSVRFRTTGCIFPKMLSLSDYDEVDTETEGYGHPLFVHVR